MFSSDYFYIHAGNIQLVSHDKLVQVRCAKCVWYQLGGSSIVSEKFRVTITDQLSKICNISNILKTKTESAVIHIYIATCSFYYNIAV